MFIHYHCHTKDNKKCINILTHIQRKILSLASLTHSTENISRKIIEISVSWKLCLADMTNIEMFVWERIHFEENENIEGIFLLTRMEWLYWREKNGFDSAWTF